MVPYGYYAPPPPSAASRFMAAAAAKTQEAARLAAEAAQKGATAASAKSMAAAQLAARAAKAKTSSEFEKLLMRTTSPTDMPVMGPDMELLFQEVRGFSRKAKRGGGQNPYEKTLHKIWNKMIDPDWRTTLKGVGVLHRLSRGAKPKDRAAFATQASKLKKSRRAKSSKKNKMLKYKYFDVRALGASMSPPPSEGLAYADFAEAYLAFVLARLADFTGPQCDELAALCAEESGGGGGGEEGADGVIASARSCVELALAVPIMAPPASPPGRSKGKKKAAAAAAAALAAAEHPKPNIVVCDCQYLVANDLEALWKGLSQTLAKRLEESAASGGELDEDLMELAQWWLAQLPKLGSWREAYAASMGAIKFKVKGGDPEEWLAAAAVESALAGVAGGGAAHDEEDEDLEDMEDDDDEEEEEGALFVVSKKKEDATAPKGEAASLNDEEDEEDDEEEEEEEDEEEEDEYYEDDE